MTDRQTDGHRRVETYCSDRQMDTKSRVGDTDMQSQTDRRMDTDRRVGDADMQTVTVRE